MCGEVSSWIWWFEHRGRVGEPVVCAGVIERLRVSPGGRDLGVESLATQLVINRRVAHGTNTLGVGFAGQHRPGVDRRWMNARLGGQAVDGCE